jgi:hypothetical protein
MATMDDARVASGSATLLVAPLPGDSSGLGIGQNVRYYGGRQFAIVESRPLGFVANILRACTDTLDNLGIDRSSLKSLASRIAIVVVSSGMVVLAGSIVKTTMDNLFPQLRLVTFVAMGLFFAWESAHLLQEMTRGLNSHS